ncbi:cucumber peeling cupredoxin-like [Dorcoceras hygrometricum]|uniref:Cucumber peeling cupredoxin-like n=1 Tax=Dorcoceras hygrometricum TaxID=472368 RepID=A0A2Z7A4Y4_9LAMI|nr:cucumber peeling cupredoxin-like [Dorcoceras hygrometricum]
MKSMAALLSIFAVALLINAAEAYTNYTVGDAAGWFFNSTTKKASAKYDAWAANKTFNLGDYLIFNTNSNQSVIQTYNETTYKNCTTDYSSDSDTFKYNGGVDQFGVPSIIAVPLTILGTQYYFSDASDGEQCRHGLAFKIKVNRGLGLPPSLNQPPPPPYSRPPAPADEGQSPPTTVGTASPPGNGVTNTSANGSWFGFLILVIYHFIIHHIATL